MSSIRLFILGSFAEHGPMHGHRLRLEAERRKVHLWTDITVGAVYGAMKRLEAEGLLKESGREQEGNRPTRQVYEITEDGRLALALLRRSGLSDIWFKFDPFDLALAGIDADGARTLPATLKGRLARVQAMLDESRRVNAESAPHVSPGKQWALKHTEYRLEAEVRYLTDLSKVAHTITPHDAKAAKKKK